MITVYLCSCRKITAEESSRISIENQLQSEQAKASTAVVDADKYRYLPFGGLICYLFSPLLNFDQEKKIHHKKDTGKNLRSLQLSGSFTVVPSKFSFENQYIFNLAAGENCDDYQPGYMFC